MFMRKGWGDTEGRGVCHDGIALCEFDPYPQRDLDVDLPILYVNTIATMHSREFCTILGHP